MPAAIDRVLRAFARPLAWPQFGRAEPRDDAADLAAQLLGNLARDLSRRHLVRG